MGSSHDFIPMKDVYDRPGGLPLASWALQGFIRIGVVGGEAACYDMVSDGPIVSREGCVLTESLHRVLESFNISYRNRRIVLSLLEFAYWATNIESMEVQSPSLIPWQGRIRGSPLWMKVMKNEEHYWMSIVVIQIPLRMFNNESSRLLSRVLRGGLFVGNLEDMLVILLGVHSQGDCGNVPLMIIGNVTQVIAPEKDSIIAPPSTPPGNDLNIAVESGSSWIDYIGPLTSDEIDSDKRWSYRDPNGNIHGEIFSQGVLLWWEIDARDGFLSDEMVKWFVEYPLHSKHKDCFERRLLCPCGGTFEFPQTKQFWFAVLQKALYI
ncbi:hypothetical protein Tco_0231973 [Tanacetum coccineum]